MSLPVSNLARAARNALNRTTVNHSHFFDPSAIFSVIKHVYWCLHIFIVTSVRFHYTKHLELAEQRNTMILSLLLQKVLETTISPLVLVSLLHCTRCATKDGCVIHHDILGMFRDKTRQQLHGKQGHTSRIQQLQKVPLALGD